MWLLNRTTTKAVERMTPFEAAFGKKPDLKCVREWGEKVYVRVEGGTKLGGTVQEGQWIGIDLESKGARRTTRRSMLKEISISTKWQLIALKTKTNKSYL